MLALAHLTQRVPLWPEQARVLRLALEQHLAQLSGRSARGQLTLPEALSLKPLGRLLQQLTRQLTTPWPRHGAQRRHQPRQRQWRLPFDELLLLNGLYCEGTLSRCLEGADQAALVPLGGELHRAAQNLSYYFQL